jgi:hypothetical protein
MRPSLRPEVVMLHADHQTPVGAYTPPTGVGGASVHQERPAEPYGPQEPPPAS